MPLRSQVFLAATMATSTLGTLIAISPPNLDRENIPSVFHFLTCNFITLLRQAPLSLLTLHTCLLIYFHPNIPPSIARYGAANGLNTSSITWSTATSIPLILILCLGVPLRLVSYGSLGTNFTFTLTEPSHLVTEGVYRYLQHPSYTGALILVFCNAALLCRIDGALSCWIPPRWYQSVRIFWRRYLTPIWVSSVFVGIGIRVAQEERMLLDMFGAEWERWHAETARFVPWVF